MKNSSLNAIDYVEIIPPQNPGDIPLILVFCVHPLPTTPPLNEQNVQITGGTRVTNIGVEWAQPAANLIPPPATGERLSSFEVNALQTEIGLTSADPSTVLVVRPTSDGDFSPYTLSLVASKDSTNAPPNFDTILSQIVFGFKVECPSDFDCKTQLECPPQTFDEPVIDYMAKDYESFRQLMLNRLAVLMPNWTETHAADIGVMLVELLAYLGDQLSYYQDAVATEAYLGTARNRISMRRHARLLDYFMHEGCNSRAWVRIQVDNSFDGTTIPLGTKLLTGAEGDPTIVRQQEFEEASSNSALFETMFDLNPYNALNELHFYTWGEPDCCLPKGATTATLDNTSYNLETPIFTWPTAPGPITGDLADYLTNWLELGWVKSSMSFAMPNSKEISVSDGVNLLWITLSADSSTANVSVNNNPIDELAVQKQNDGSLQLSVLLLRVGDFISLEEIRSPTLKDVADADPTHRQIVRLTNVSRDFDDLTQTPVVKIAWDPVDALSFPLCLTQVLDPELSLMAPVSVAYGNVVLVDNGYTMDTGNLPTPVYENDTMFTQYTETLGSVPQEGTFRPSLSNQPLTFSAPFDATQPAASALNYDVRTAIPAIHLIGENSVWSPQRDLLESDPFAYDFVVEVSDNGVAYIRFGDNIFGRQPIASTQQQPSTFYAIYRIGNGSQGNVGRETISRIASYSPFDATGVSSVINPIEAQGGTDPEPIEDVRQFAPQAFRTQERAVTTADYAQILEAYPGVRSALADFRWTGSWYTVFVAVDPLATQPDTDVFMAGVEQYLDAYRLAGYDLEISTPLYVPLDISVNVCVAPDFFWSDVESALLNAFSNKILPDGTKGFFYPDNFTFGQSVYLSNVIETAMNVPGVSYVTVGTFQRLTENSTIPSSNGEIEIGPFEIARVDNDPNFPENGRIQFTQMEGNT